ncbi:hypothetical protein Acsp04_44010 [Actinomadura sp. NBRC 104425]|uniref:polymorphic toxin-type HINT domain-containing protein n=1 Tax=Actinomadura sp. NBRC 104425 TaxID=3032204 RepID=UPI0024A36DCE|nr:polymorphic toxin-type HINT domain-containing protein [Actinomadura sp. NBRC 104425]GLZ14166.1 hypothetical protein Acsp04_44010 [Actinomadura sp. NBRC 104425]
MEELIDSSFLTGSQAWGRQMLRRLGDQGEGALSYIAITLLVAAVAAAVTVVAVPDTVTRDVRAAVCRVVGSKDCGSGHRGGKPNSSTSPSSSAPVTAPVGGESPEEQEYRAAQDAAARADQEARAIENEWNNFNLLKEIAELGLDWLAGDIINCIRKPNLSDCIWGLLGIIPWGKLGKALKAIPKVVKLIDRFLDLKRRLEKARGARKAAQERLRKALAACQGAAPNSFPPGTLVLMADGSRRPIERVAVGDLVWATDPETGRDGPRRVTRTIAGAGSKDLVDVVVDLDGSPGGPTAVVTATANHPFWVAGTRDWIDGGRLVFGDMLAAPDGRRALVVETRRYSAERRVHNLTVEGFHTFYVTVGGLDLLVHNDPGKRACDLLAKERAKIANDIDDALENGRFEDADLLIDQAQANVNEVWEVARRNPTKANRDAATQAQREVDLLKKKVVDAKIDEAMQSGNWRKRTEATTAKSIRNIVRDFNRKFGPNGRDGEIDIETNRAIVEVATGKNMDKEGQVKGLLSDRQKNPQAKPVIVLATQWSGKQRAMIERLGATVVRNEYELKQALRRLGEPV